MEPATPSLSNEPAGGFDRRALLRRAAVAGAVGWVAPVILTSDPAAAGVFTAKCAPGTITATAGFTNVPGGCLATSSTINITITFSGPCPCGGTKLWCSQKNSPGSQVTGTNVLSFPVTIGIGTTITINGKVALGCTDRDGDTQYAVYNWTMTARDNGGPCSPPSPNSISAVTLSGRTLVTGGACPSLSALAAPVAAAASTPAPSGMVRPA